MDGPLGALNLTRMEAGHVQGWRYVSTDFVVSLAIRRAPLGVRDLRAGIAGRPAMDEVLAADRATNAFFTL